MAAPKMLVNRIKNKFHYHKYSFFEKKLFQNGGSLITVIKTPFNLSVLYDADEFSKMVSNSAKEYNLPPIGDFRDGLKKGGAVFLLLDGKNIIHGSKVILDKDFAAINDRIFKRFKSQDAGYIGPCFTHPAYRGKGLYTYVLLKICDFLKEKGKERAFICTKTNNLASMRGIEKAGFRIKYEIGLLKILFFDFLIKCKNA